MATSEQEDDLHSLLECHICLESMVSPRVLPCMHSFCEKCLAQHMSTEGKQGLFPCALCRKEHTVPSDGVTGFMKNEFLSKLASALAVGSEAKCDVCKIVHVDNDAVSLCIQCSMQLCPRCSKHHSGATPNKKHKVVFLEDVQKGLHVEEIMKTKKSVCPTHANKDLKFYCKPCKQALCSACVVETHSQHRLSDLGEEARLAKKILKDVLNEKSTKAMRRANSICDARKKIVDGISQQREDAIAAVSQAFEDYREYILNQVKLSQEKALENLLKQAEMARKQAEVAYHEAELSRVAVSTVVDVANKFIQSDRYVEKLQQFPELKRHLEDFNPNDYETEVCRPTLRLEPRELPLPDLSELTKQIDEQLMQQIKENLNIITGQFGVGNPKILERADTTVVLNTKQTGEEECSCTGFCFSDEYVIVSDCGNSNVKVFDRTSHSFLFSVNQEQHKLQTPVSVTCSPKSGDIFVTDVGIQGVVKYDNKGQLMKVFSGVHKSSAIVCDSDMLFIADDDNEQIVVADMDCCVKRVISKDSLGLEAFNPVCMSVDNKGRLLVGVMQGKVHVVDHHRGSLVTSYKSELMTNPHSVCADEWGNLLCVNKDGHYIVISDVAKGIVYVPITPLDVDHPVGAVVTGKGEVAVLQSNGEIKIFKYV